MADFPTGIGFGKFIFLIYEIVEQRYSIGNWHRGGGDCYADCIGVQGPASGSEERDPGSEKDIDERYGSSAYRIHR
jgi:hypothetical protein